MFRPMGQFMRQRSGMAFGVLEGLEGRHLHVIGLLGVVGTRAAVSNIGAGRGKELLGTLDARKWGQGRGLGRGGILRRQAFALLGVENGVPLQERDFALGLLAVVVGLGAGDAVGLDDQLATLALADIAAELLRLFEGQP